MNKGISVIIGLLILLSIGVSAEESVSQLRENYGLNKTTWSNGTLTFTASGAINFNKANYKGYIWEVPQEVKKIIINANVTVNGAFHIFGTTTIEGKNRKTSVIYGTDEARWADNRNLDEWNYCQIQIFGGTATIQNLTILNPRSYSVRAWGFKVLMSYCDVIDNRGGWGNHSDGVSGGPGTVIDNCYFETGDDVIKVYFPDMTISNCHIKMITNAVPFQFGWGSYGNASATVINTLIDGTAGRDQAEGRMPVFEWQSGNNVKSITLDGCTINNPNASLFRLLPSGATLNVTITNSYINVNKYAADLNTQGTRIICGSTSEKNFYDCSGGATPPPTTAPTPSPIPTQTPVPTPRNPFTGIEAEDFSGQSGGLQTAAYCAPHLAQIDGSEWAAYGNVKFTEAAGGFKARVTSGGAGGSIEIRTGSATGTLAGTLSVPNTGGWCNYQELSCNVNIAAGTRTVYLVFRGGSDIFDVDRFSFSAGSTNPTPGPAVYGDVNSDGVINILDALMTAQYSVGLNPQGFTSSRADVNCDGTVNIVDALAIARYSVGLEGSFLCS